IPHRLPESARARCHDAALLTAQSQPSGVRLVFRTAATRVVLDVLRTTIRYQGAPPRPEGRYELHIDGEPFAETTASGGGVRYVDMATGSTETEYGPMGSVDFAALPSGDKEITIWLPHNETTRLVALRCDAAIAPAPASGKRVWLHHGS